MLITKPFKYSISTWYNWYNGIDYNYVYTKYGEMLALLELDECGSTLSLSIYDPHSDRGVFDRPIQNAAIESWNDNVLTFTAVRAYGRRVRIEIELNPQNGEIKKLTKYYSEKEYLMLTNEEEAFQNKITELQNKQVRENDSPR